MQFRCNSACQVAHRYIAMLHGSYAHKLNILFLAKGQQNKINTLHNNRSDASVPLCNTIQPSNVSPLRAWLQGPRDRYRKIRIYKLQYLGLIDAGVACREKPT